MNVRMGSAAVGFALMQHLHPSEDWVGKCLRFTRECFGVPNRYDSAASAWAHVAVGDRHSSTPPPGVPVYWTGGSHGYGHAAPSAGGGYIWSTDILGWGRVDKVHLDLIHTRWGLDLAGWGETINDVRVYTAPAPTPAGTKVHLAAVQSAFRRDPGLPQGQGTHRADVRPVELALVAEGLLDDRWAHDGSAGSKTVKAYARWQVRCSYQGSAANGIPGSASLARLGRAHGFVVV